jgi:hypothetical protein
VGPLNVEVMVEPDGIEPSTSCMPWPPFAHPAPYLPPTAFVVDAGGRSNAHRAQRVQRVARCLDSLHACIDGQVNRADAHWSRRPTNKRGVLRPPSRSQTPTSARCDVHTKGPDLVH